MFRSKTTPPIIMIRDIAFQNLTQEDKHVLSMPRQLSAAGTLVVPEDNLARNVAAKLREARANRIIVLEDGTQNVFGAIAKTQLGRGLLGRGHGCRGCLRASKEPEDLVSWCWTIWCRRTTTLNRIPT
jgi:hypothetical protein